MRQSRFKWMAWWYSAISLGFVLLAVNRALNGELLWLVGVRLIIAGGFAILAYMEFKNKPPSR
jgi:hypothetical protein